MNWGLEGVSVLLGGTIALDGVDLPIAPGSVAVVVGADGAGKTTLVRVVVGLVDIDSGVVNRPSRRRIGFQPASSGVWRELSVLENLEFVADAHALRGAERAAMIDRLLDATHLGPARERLGGLLSGGMRQKLGVAMALVHRPELVVLDEPTTGLDPVSRSELWTVIAGAAADGAAVVLTSTYLDEAERGDTILALDRGRPLAAGTVADVRTGTPGVLVEVDGPDGARSWRRGRSWRRWHPDAAPAGSTSIEPDLSDLVTIAAIRQREEMHL